MTHTAATQSLPTDRQSGLCRVVPERFEAFAQSTFQSFCVPDRIAALGIRSMLDASLLGIETHGIESLEMYVNHLSGGGLKADRDPIKVSGKGPVETWDMQSGFGLAGARTIMERAIDVAKELGIYFATVRNTNHIGACGAYGKMAADQGLIGLVSQQSFASL